MVFYGFLSWSCLLDPPFDLLFLVVGGLVWLVRYFVALWLQTLAETEKDFWKRKIIRKWLLNVNIIMNH